jgi:microcompartment protein CcmL/EutN
MSALGLVETRGLAPRWRRWTRCLKTVDVTYAVQKRVGGGLVAVLVEGDLASVKSAGI